MTCSSVGYAERAILQEQMTRGAEMMIVMFYWPKEATSWLIIAPINADGVSGRHLNVSQ
jgi:hypothetical protein